jgi:hypothetical protein
MPWSARIIHREPRDFSVKCPKTQDARHLIAGCFQKLLGTLLENAHSEEV